MSNHVAELKQVPLRDQWPNEEADFTPWLVDNISYLSGILEIDLEVQDTEANVGSYFADIYATDIDGDRDVIIENQYGLTDHKHLGQSLVYAGGFDADIVVWVAEEFTDPHLDAIQWFNSRTDEETGIFAVEVSLVQIGDSPVAPRFDLVERPSSWKAIAGELNETRREHRRFWHVFEKRLEERELSEYIMNRTATTASYVTKRLGDAYIRPSATVHNRIYCTLRIKDKSGEFGGLIPDEINQELLSALSEMSVNSISESEVRDIEWESNPGKLYDKCVVRYSKQVDRSDESRWDEYHDWLIDITLLFDEVFSPHF